MKIRWHGHACFELSDGQVVVTDPHDGKYIGIPPPRVRGDIILVSHDHPDHNSVKTVRGASSRVYDRPGSYQDGRIKITGVPSYHDDAHGQKRGQVVIFRIEMEGIRICHLGDLGCVPGRSELEALDGVDILFVPVGNVFTIDGARAWEVVELVKPLVAVPMHYRVGGLSLSIKTVDTFLAQARGKAEVINVGNEIEFDVPDLPESLTVWVFSL